MIDWDYPNEMRGYLDVKFEIWGVALKGSCFLPKLANGKTIKEGKMKKIIAVDNHPMTLRLMENLLEKAGYEVRIAQDGLAALELLETFSPDIMFIDLIMPNIRGDKLCRIIRSKPKFKDTYLVIVSAAAHGEDLDFISFGANACIAKGPFEKTANHILTVLEELAKESPPDLTKRVLGREDGYKRPFTLELLADNKHLGVIFENMSDGIIEVHPSQKIIYTNPVALNLIGETEEKLLATDFIDLFAENEHLRIQENFKGVKHQQQKIGYDDPVVLNDTMLMLNFLPIKDNGHHSTIIIIQDITALKQADEEREKLINQLQEALAEVKTLRGILPFCSFCKKIRDDKGYWQQVDVYIHQYSEADISHSICPECMKKHYPEFSD